jgi:hypothetical protein
LVALVQFGDAVVNGEVIDEGDLAGGVVPPA